MAYEISAYRSRLRTLLSLGGFSIFFFLFGFLRFHSESQPTELALLSGSFHTFSLEARVIEEPIETTQLRQLVVQPETIQGRLSVRTSLYPIISYGDIISLEGKIDRLPKELKARRFLQLQRIDAVMSFPKIKIISSEKTWDFFSLFIWLRKHVRERIETILPEPQAGFASGILLGLRSGIREDLENAFQRSGLIHILAISGYNITLVILFAEAIFSFLPRKLRLWVIGFFVFAFTILAGASASAVRAALMGILGLGARFFGREHTALHFLFLAAFGMVLWNPFVLVYDIGFQLSFAATFGLITASRPAEKFFSWIPNFGNLRELISITMVAQCFTAPIIFWYFQRISLIAPFSNAVVLPFIPLAMMFSAATLLFSFLSDTFSSFLGSMASFLLKFILILVEWFSSFSWSSLDW